MREGAACARAAGDAWFQIYAHYNLGYIAALTGREAEGYDMMRHSLAAWRVHCDPRSISMGLNFLAPVAMRLGHHDQARAWLEESVVLSTELGDLWGLGTAYRQLGAITLAQGDVAGARAHLNRSLDIYHGYVIGYDLIYTNLYLAECAAAEGDDVEAERIYLDSIRDASAIRVDALALEATAGLAALRLRQGRADEALRLAGEVLAHPAATCATAARAAEVWRQVTLL